MTGNLLNLKKDLKSFAKRCKDFRYTNAALITFLITGVVSIRDNLFSAEMSKSIESQKQVISTSIKDMHTKVQQTRRENDKLLKKNKSGTNSAYGTGRSRSKISMEQLAIWN